VTICKTAWTQYQHWSDIQTDSTVMRDKNCRHIITVKKITDLTYTISFLRVTPKCGVKRTVLSVKNKLNYPSSVPLRHKARLGAASPMVLKPADLYSYIKFSV